MAVFKCKICGGALEVSEGLTVCECEYCGRKQTVPIENDEEIANLLERENRLGTNNKFDNAYGIYETVIDDDSGTMGADNYATNTASTIASAATQHATAPNVSSLLERAFMLLEDGNWEEANEHCERALDINPKCAEAYIGKLMAGFEAHNWADFKRKRFPVEGNINFERALLFGDENLKTKLREYNENILYREATKLYENATTEEDFILAASIFDKCIGFGDSNSRKNKCLEKAESKHNETVEQTNDIANAVIIALSTSGQKKKKQALLQEKERLESLLVNLPSYVSERDILISKRRELDEKLIKLIEERENLGLFSSKAKKEKETKISEIQNTLLSLEKRIAEYEADISDYVSKEDIKIRLNEIKAILSNLPKSTTKLSVNDARNKYNTSKEIREIVNEKCPVIQFADRWLKKIEFGLYPRIHQDKKEPIKWIVLCREEKRVLVISKDILDCKKYNENFENVTWERCSLREWLNNGFLMEAFNDKERSIIATTSLQTLENNRYGNVGTGSNDVEDKIFLLSIEELLNSSYFKSADARKGKPTPYVIEHGLAKARGDYWSRSPGAMQDYAAGVHDSGKVNEYGWEVNNAHIGVRPAMWINIE